MTHIGAHKKPMLGRLWPAGVWCALVAWSVPAASQESAAWEVDDVVQAALSHPELETILARRLAEIDAEVAERTRVPNPTLGADYEQMFGNDAESLELSLVVTQELDWTGWRSALRASAEHLGDAATADNRRLRLEVATAVRTTFYAVRYREERLRALDAWHERLARAIESLAARESGGDVSRYDVRRLERESEVALAERAREEVLLAESWAELQAWAGWAERQRLAGELRPAAPTESAGEIPELQRLEALIQANQAESSALGNAWLRGWTAGAGYRFADLGAVTGHGLLLVLTVPLPFSDADAPSRDRLAADGERLAAELSLEQRLTEQQMQAAQARLEQALAALDALPAAEMDEELPAMAEAGFAAGEVGLTELLDAYESALELQLVRIDLAWEARRAAIDLDRRRGLGAP